MAILLSTSDIIVNSSVTNLTNTSFDKSSWVGDLITNGTLMNKLSPSTKYYIHYTVKKIANPISHFYTTQSWGYTMLYNGSSSVGCVGLTKNQYENMEIGESITLNGSFTTPSSLENWRMVFYSARYSGDASDWGSNAELVPVRICNFEVSNTPFTDNLSLHKTGDFRCINFNEQNKLELTSICINANNLIEY